MIPFTLVYARFFQPVIISPRGILVLGLYVIERDLSNGCGGVFDKAFYK